jgi:dTDP-4-dehydrorhamnose 3,5-epimerase-like enzyme
MFEKSMADKPELISGRCVVDDRGSVSFVNDFAFPGVKRFYTVTNHSAGFVRAWHGHHYEAKYCSAVTGSFLVCCIRIDDWEKPSRDLPIHRFTLSELSPAVLYVPPGFVNGFKSLTDGAKILFYSTAKLEDSLKDDIRFPARTWDPWAVEER